MIGIKKQVSFLVAFCSLVTGQLRLDLIKGLGWLLFTPPQVVVEKKRESKEVNKI
tara:strand:+ start:147 stop:311 length:165 start_codon:yes stop_codon:yes gene_type:complete